MLTHGLNNLYQIGSFIQRNRAKFVFLLILVSFILIFVVPGVLAEDLGGGSCC